MSHESKYLLKQWLFFFSSFSFCLSSFNPAQGQLSVFEDGFEAGTACRWTASSPPTGNCPPTFPGIILVVANDMDEMTVTWFAAEDDSTPTNLIDYQIHVSQVPDFEPDLGTLALSVSGDTQSVVPGLIPDTAYHVLILAEDEEGATSLERGYRTVTTPAFPVVLGDTPLQEAEDLNLDEPTSVTDTSLTFARTAEAIPPDVGSLLAGQFGSGGYLRSVEGVTLTPSEIVVETNDASLADAVDQIGISSSLFLSDISGIEESEISFAGGVATRRFRTPDHGEHGREGWTGPLLIAEQTDYLLRKNGTEKTLIESNDVTIDVSVIFEPELLLSGSWSLFGGIESGEAIARGTLALNASAVYDFSGASSFEPDPIQLFERTWFAYYHIGAVPVLQRITLDVQVLISATASTEITASATANASATVEFGVRYDPISEEWEPVSGVSFERAMSANLDVKGSVVAEVRVVPRITVEFYETIAADLSIEPSLNGSIAAESTAAPLCAPFELTSFDFVLGVDCFAGVDFTAFNLDYSLVDNLRVCGPFSYPLFDLPQIVLSTSGSGSTGDPLQVTAEVTDGTNNPFSPESAAWDASPETGELTVTSVSPPVAEFTCGGDDMYTICFSGHGRLGELARRCFELEHTCTDECMTGTWVDNFGYVWELVQVGSSIIGVVTFDVCGPGRDVTGTFDGSNVSLTALGAGADCCDFTYTGTISECSSGSGGWVQFPGDPTCDGSGTWSMTRVSEASELPVEDPTLAVTPAKVPLVP